ncbi:hypothetical protein CIW49_20155 [Mycolicibacterium sp. P1-18]|uniref:hypothetical protein n=1 Tax=Mycolicibacterium sp. P1-18 TaxID=2024615 RepID=UPI0011F0ADF1|nr:hypothetical protein [Mycolicibacterium sp. P1-18]KAA0095889.1 hypothetical protein CIW49_20155 [Mycolicibacterium sp. P1-18]
MTASGVLVDAGVASVRRLGFCDATARCSCGWSGRRRLLVAAAEQDAWTHAMRDRCEVSSPLVLDW